MDFANALKDFLTTDSAQTRHEIVVLSERVGNVQGQLDVTNRRLEDIPAQMNTRVSDLNTNYLDLGRRMESGFAELRRYVEERLVASDKQNAERFARVENKVDGLESRVSSLEKKVDSLESRVSSLEKKIDSLENKVEGLYALVQSRFDELRELIQLILQNTTPRLEHESLATRMTTAEKAIDELKRNLPGEAA